MPLSSHRSIDMFIWKATLATTLIKLQRQMLTEDHPNPLQNPLAPHHQPPHHIASRQSPPRSFLSSSSQAPRYPLPPAKLTISVVSSTSSVFSLLTNKYQNRLNSSTCPCCSSCPLCHCTSGPACSLSTSCCSYQ